MDWIVKQTIKAKANSFGKAVGDGLSMETETQSSDPVQLTGEQKRSKWSKLSRDQKQLYAHKAQEFGNTLSIQMKSRHWIAYETTEDLLQVDYLENKAYPMCAYRVRGTLMTTAIKLPELAKLYLDLEQRRLWDADSSPKSKTLCECAKGVTLDYVVHAKALGGIVSERDYVDVRAYDAVPTSRGKMVSRAYLGSVICDEVFDDGCVRGWNYAQGCTFELTEDGAGIAMSMTSHRDYKGWLPYAAAERATPAALLAEFRAFRTFVEQNYPHSAAASPAASDNPEAVATTAETAPASVAPTAQKKKLSLRRAPPSPRNAEPPSSPSNPSSSGASSSPRQMAPAAPRPPLSPRKLAPLPKQAPINNNGDLRLEDL